MGDTIELLYVFSLIGTVLGCIGTTIIQLTDRKITGTWVWVVGNAAMLVFTVVMGYFDQTIMWVYYEVLNITTIYRYKKRLVNKKHN